MRTLKFLAPVALLTVAACAPVIQSEVTRFHTPAVAEARGSFSIQPPDAGKSGSLEFQTYAQYVAQALEAQGFRQTAAAGDPDYIVTVDYGVGPGQQVIETRPGFGYGGFGPYGGFGYGGFGRYGFGGYGRFGFYDPFWGPAGLWDYPEIYSYTKYPSRLKVEIRSKAGPVIFEGRALADTRSRDLTVIIPKLVQSMFADFPGRSGQTVVVSIDDKGRATSKLARR